MASNQQELVDSVDGSSDRKTVVRVVAVVNALARAEPGGIGVRELATKIGISRSAVHRALSHLAGLGYASLLPHDRYEAGPLTLGWTAILAEQHGFEAAINGALGTLVERFGESAYGFEYAPKTQDLVVVAGEHTTQPVRYLLEVGSHAPLYAGASGKAVLAFLDPKVVDKLDIQRLTPATISSKSKLRADLATVAARGFATSQGERISDAFGIAAPVFAGDNVVGAITLTIPRYRFVESMLAEQAAAVLAAAAGATRLLSPQQP